MQDSFFALRAAKQPARAAVVGLTLFTHSSRATHRTLARHGEWLGITVALVHHHAHHFGNHIAGTAYHHGVAQAHILATGFILVVQRGIGHRDAAHKHGRQLGHRGEFAGAAHLHIDAQHRGQLLLGRVFVRHGPARLTADKAELALRGQAVDFVDHTINVKGQCITR